MFSHTVTTFIILSLNSVFAIPVRQATKSTCNACHPTVEGKTNVHIIAHSHDDVGWLKTVDQYYYGSGAFGNIETAGVQFIISSVVDALRSHPERRFIQVETAFFWKWWQKQNEHVQQDVIDLVNNGQLEITNGAWSMNDEAATHYHSTIDQYTWGFRILNDTLGECGRPKIGWQIDPFGHSREHASLLNQLGFQGMIIGRIDYRDKEKRRGSGELDLMWKTNDNFENSNIFTSMFPDLYASDSGFCFDITCLEKPINDDPESPDYNLLQKVNQFAQRLDLYTPYYSTANILIPMGGDFNYQAAEINFLSLDKLIKGFSNHPKYNVIYSTPSCFIEAVNKEINLKKIALSEKSDDFFPYASDEHSFWTGYFTSRPTYKRYEREANNILQSAKQIASFSKVQGLDIDEFLNDLRSAVGVMQHHDAITGTEKQAVAFDYARILSKALGKTEKAVGEAIGKLLQKEPELKTTLKVSSCLLSNISICWESQQNRFLVVVQNPLSRRVTHHVRLPVNTTSYKIIGPDGKEAYDVFDTIHSFDYVQENSTPSKKELVFAARDLPPLGIKMYYIEKISAFEDTNHKPRKDDNYFGTESNGFTVDLSTGKLLSITLNNIAMNITQDFLYYTSWNGNNAGAANRASGAYIFRPTEVEAVPISSQIQEFRSARGTLCDEFLQVFNEEISQIIRVYKDTEDSYIEFDWVVGNLQFVDQKGKEVITRFTINGFTNNGTFYTDSNGRQTIKRQLNTRSDYDYDFSEEPISSNYYPVTSKLSIRDDNKQLEVAVLTDRAQGGTSLNDGEIELMVHRRCTRDDGFGVGEILSEKQYDVGLYVRGRHYLTFGSTLPPEEGLSILAYERELAQRKVLTPWVLIADATSSDLDSFAKVESLYNLVFSGLLRSLPINVQILTFEPWKEESFILRLEHVLEKGDDVALSQPSTIDLHNLFTSFNIEISETTLGANQLLNDYINEKKLVWNGITPSPGSGLDEDNPLQVRLSPMEIRTFLVTAKQK